MLLKGSIVALVTPMQASLAIDIKKYVELINWHLESNTQGIVVLGSTGESATITPYERANLLKIAVDTVKGRIPVIAGTGTNNTITTIAETKLAESLGVDACLIVTPYYNRPTQEGLIAHYKAISDNVNLPIILYNVPKRTGCDILPQTLEKLTNCKNIIAIKEATGNVARVAEIKSLIGDRFTLLSGDDETALEFMLTGGKGVISVIANIFPEIFYNLCQATLTNDIIKAKDINNKLKKIYAALTLEPNPIPVKWALSYLNLIEPGIRLPLTNFSSKYHTVMINALNDLNFNTGGHSR